MQRILRLADGAEVSAKVQKNGLHGTGSGIDSEKQWFHVVLSKGVFYERSSMLSRKFVTQSL
jgi:hypothetical protein